MAPDYDIRGQAYRGRQGDPHRAGWGLNIFGIGGIFYKKGVERVDEMGDLGYNALSVSPLGVWRSGEEIPWLFRLGGASNVA